jgi:hypothetical protein
VISISPTDLNGYITVEVEYRDPASGREWATKTSSKDQEILLAASLKALKHLQWDEVSEEMASMVYPMEFESF